MGRYREFSPSPTLGEFVECFWMHTPSEHHVLIMPDTCVDLIYSRERGLQLVGTMTRAAIDQIQHETLFGARLHAAAVGAFFDIPVSELNDCVVAVEDLGLRIRSVGEIADARAFERILAPKSVLTPVQRALQYLAASGGKVRLESVCRATGLSLRRGEDRQRRRSLACHNEAR